MIRSFLKVFLPDDEYKRLRILYFMAESTFLTVAILLLIGLMKYVFHITYFDTDFLLLLGPFLMMTYVYFRYIFSGIEHTEVSSEKAYKLRRRVAAGRAMFAGVVFFIIFLIVKGIPTTYVEWSDLIALPIIFMLVYFIFDVISLKQSMKKIRD